MAVRRFHLHLLVARFCLATRVTTPDLRPAGGQDENKLSFQAPPSKTISRSRDFPSAYSNSTSTPLRVPRTALILALRPTIPRRTSTAFAFSLWLCFPLSAARSAAFSLIRNCDLADKPSQTLSWFPLSSAARISTNAARAIDCSSGPMTGGRSGPRVHPARSNHRNTIPTRVEDGCLNTVTSLEGNESRCSPGGRIQPTSRDPGQVEQKLNRT